MQISNFDSKELLKAVYELARRYSHWDVDCDELVQTVLYNLLKTSSRPHNLSGWLFTATKNAAVDLLYETSGNRRGQKISPRQVVCEKVLEDYEVGRKEEDFYGYEVGREEKELNLELLLDQLETLTPTHSTSIKLYAAGYSYEEIAQLTDSKTNTVRSRIHYARKYLSKFNPENTI